MDQLDRAKPLAPTSRASPARWVFPARWKSRLSICACAPVRGEALLVGQDGSAILEVRWLRFDMCAVRMRSSREAIEVAKVRRTEVVYSEPQLPNRLRGLVSPPQVLSLDKKVRFCPRHTGNSMRHGH
jgi:hypothetical protein